MIANRKKMRYALVLTLAVLLLAASVACLVADRRAAHPRAQGDALFIAGLALMLADSALVFRAYVWPMLEALHFIMVMDSDSDKREQLLRSKHARNDLVDYILKLMNTVNLQREQEYSLEILKRQAELNALQSQINPHFLYNTLDSIRGQMLAVDLDNAANTVEALSNLFRYSINPRTVYNTLEQELENVQNYMRIITYRFGGRIRFREVIDDDCTYILNCEMPKLTLQPIIENAIQHGLETRKQDGLITVRAFVHQQGLHIQVSDNGIGIPQDALDELNRRLREGSPILKTQGSGIGLVNVNERIRMLYGGDYGLYVNSDVGIGTEVHILLPVQLIPASSLME